MKKVYNKIKTDLDLSFNKVCPICNNQFTASNNAHVYCSLKCRTKRQYSKKQDADWRKKPKTCKTCGNEFIIPENSSPIRSYCSETCQIIGYKKHTRAFRDAKPGAMKIYNERRRLKYGNGDGLVERLYKKYQDLPKTCEAIGCNESRVIDLAHKPSYKRNGAYRIMKHYERHMFWILCPTHHAIIDRGVLKPKEIGLQE